MLYFLIKFKCFKNFTTFRTHLQRRNAIRRGPILQYNTPVDSTTATCKTTLNNYEPTVTFSTPKTGLDF